MLQENLIINITLDNVHTQNLCRTANEFTSKVLLEYQGKKVDVKSLFGLVSLGLIKGTEVQIIVEGNDTENAMKAIKEILL